MANDQRLALKTPSPFPQPTIVQQTAIAKVARQLNHVRINWQRI
jgi:hypothetical protein